MPRIALPNKGRLADDARELFTDAGLDVRVRGDRALSASLGGIFEAIFVRAADIPEFVADGAADLGVTGWDLITESERDLVPLLDLELGRCRLSVAATEDSCIRRVDDVRGTQPSIDARRVGAHPRCEQDPRGNRYEARVGRHRVAVQSCSGAERVRNQVGSGLERAQRDDDLRDGGSYAGTRAEERRDVDRNGRTHRRGHRRLLPHIDPYPVASNAG